MKNEENYYQVEVVPKKYSRKASKTFYKTISELAVVYGAFMTGNYDLRGKVQEDNSSSLFENEENAKTFKSEIIDRNLANAVWIRPILKSKLEKKSEEN